MKSIDEYIKASENMQNTSDGGSAAYHFEDVVLVKYSTLSKYGIARKNEELIMKIVNEKRKNGVNTPAHLEIKREDIGEENICWVLQERAKGKCFSQYSSRIVDTKTLLERQDILLNAPQSHYEKCIKDLCELFHMGLETKDKNIFYDETEGFIFIDLLNANGTPLNPNSIKDIFMLGRYAQFMYYTPMISSYDRKATEEDKNKSKIFQYKMMLKVFMAMKSVIPNFAQFERWVLRSYSKDVLDFFESLGYKVGDLSLSDVEYERFSNMIESIVSDSLEKIISGKYSFWQIGANEIRIDLSRMGLNYTWMYHKLNTRTREEFESDYDYTSTCAKDLEEMVNKMFNDKLEVLASNTDNPFVKEAKEALDKKRSQGRL